MGGGFFVTDSSHREEYEEGGVTSFVVIACIVAAMGGLLFGYDIGISGLFLAYQEIYHVLCFIMLIVLMVNMCL